MKLQTASGQVYAVHFHYEHVEHPLYSAITLCTVHQGDCPKKGFPCGAPSVSIGMACTSRKKDKFSGRKGQKWALRRALNAAFARNVRTEIWVAYLKVVPPEKAKP